MKKVLFVAALLSLATTGYAEEKRLNLYTWSNYIPADVIHAFEKKTGIIVNVSEYDSNNTMYTKLKTAPHIGYDVIIPSSYFVDKMSHQGMLQKLGLQSIPNVKYINPQLLNKPFDPGNRYSLPYDYGTTGIVFNKQYWNAKTITQWSDLWQRRFRDQLLILDDKREAFSIAMIRLGYSINDRNPKHIRQAYELLRQLMPNIKLFNSDANVAIYTDDDATVGIGWSGDTFLATEENPHLDFIYPKGGFAIWVDCYAIPKYAEHPNNARRFIDFMLKPKISKMIIEANGYSTANTAAMKLVDKSIRDNPMVNPSDAILSKGQYQADVGDAEKVYEHYWQLLKIST